MRGLCREDLAAWTCSLIWIFAPAAGRAAIPVEGIADRTVYTDRVSFRVPTGAGFAYTVELNGDPAPAGVQIEVDRADYYELSVLRREEATGAEETRVVRFIVRASERGNSEWGLPPWVPYPPIPSAAAEFVGARLEIVTPAAFPQGLEIPVIARVEDDGGHRVGVNGIVGAAEFPDHALRLLRGVGSAFLPPASASGVLSYTAEIQTLRTPKEIRIEAVTSWQAVSGSLNASTDWGEDARVRVTGDLTIAAGATLSIGAGSVIELAPGVEVIIRGTLRIRGTADRPVVFTPERRSAPWGGVVLRSSAARADLEGAILTGSGADPDWFDHNPGSGSSHRHEEPCIYVGDGARATLTDCAIIDSRGQAGHGEGARVTMTRCLVQKAISTGQYNGGSVVMNDCALIEFPAYDAPFADLDNDALYLTGGSHSLTDCLIGWALDDGVDAGSGSGGSVGVEGCWIESCYHEGLAWSADGRRPTSNDTVVLNCGQGIECGWDGPDVVADHCLSTANLVGARFGDNYDWSYRGFLKVTNSLLLYNRRDIWGRAWDDWTEHLDRMDLHDNFLTAADPKHPDNEVWQPEVDAPRLEPFLPAPADVVGVGLATWAEAFDMSEVPDGVPVRLSTFTTHEVAVDYAVEADGAGLDGGTLRFVPGETVKRIPLDIPDLESHHILVVSLVNPSGAELTGLARVYATRSVELIPTGSEWAYLDDGSNQGTAWRALGFDDSGWSRGPAELGYGDGDEATTISYGPDRNDKYRCYYFRRSFDVEDPSAFGSLVIHLRRDDGAIVYIDDVEVFRSHMPGGAVNYRTRAIDAVSGGDEDAFFTKEVEATMLVAGRNVVAVEVHQANATSSDISFELELIGIPVPPTPGETRFIRSDANGDGAIDLGDPISILAALFAGQASLCEAAEDVNGDESRDIGDPVYLLNYLFMSGPAPPAPFPRCGPDPSGGAFGCEAYPTCP